MASGSRSSRTRLYLGAGLALLVVAGAAGFARLKGASADIDPSKIVVAESGTMVRSVVATGKVEPITKVEIKSKANGIIKALPVDVDRQVEAGDVLVELDQEQLMARVAEARANLQAAARRSRAPRRSSRRTSSKRKGPDVEFARRAYRARAARSSRRSSSRSRSSTMRTAPLDVAENRKRAAAVAAAVSQARVVRGARRRWRRPRRRPIAPPRDLANATIRAPIRGTVLTRDVEIGSPVSSILNLGANATLVMTLGDIDQVFVRGKVDEADIGRVRLGQPARIRVETFKDKVFNGTRHADFADGRREGQRHELRGARLDRQPRQGAQGQHDGQRRDRARGAPELAASFPRPRSTYDAQKQRVRRRASHPGARPAAAASPVKLGVGNGTKIAGARGPQRKATRSSCRPRSPSCAKPSSSRSRTCAPTSCAAS